MSYLCVRCRMFVDAVDPVEQTCPRCTKESKQKPKPFTWDDLQALKSHALETYKNIPYNAQLPGRDKPLTGEEQRIVALVDATILLLQSKGYLKLGPTDKIVAFTHIDNEPID